MKKPAGSWFGARLLFECVVDPDTDADDATFEDRIILVQAVDEQEAERKAASAGKKAEHSYKNQFGDTVVWTFREMLDVVPMYDSDLVHGTEIYSSLIGRNEAEKLRHRFGKVSTPPSPHP